MVPGHDSYTNSDPGCVTRRKREATTNRLIDAPIMPDFSLDNDEQHYALTWALMQGSMQTCKTCTLCVGGTVCEFKLKRRSWRILSPLTAVSVVFLLLASFCGLSSSFWPAQIHHAPVATAYKSLQARWDQRIPKKESSILLASAFLHPVRFCLLRKSQPSVRVHPQKQILRMGLGNREGVRSQGPTEGGIGGSAVASRGRDEERILLELEKELSLVKQGKSLDYGTALNGMVALSRFKSRGSIGRRVDAAMLACSKVIQEQAMQLSIKEIAQALKAAGGHARFIALYSSASDALRKFPIEAFTPRGIATLMNLYSRALSQWQTGTTSAPRDGRVHEHAFDQQASTVLYLAECSLETPHSEFNAHDVSNILNALSHVIVYEDAVRASNGVVQRVFDHMSDAILSVGVQDFGSQAIANSLNAYASTSSPLSQPVASHLTAAALACSSQGALPARHIAMMLNALSRLGVPPSAPLLVHLASSLEAVENAQVGPFEISLIAGACSKLGLLELEEGKALMRTVWTLAAGIEDARWDAQTATILLGAYLKVAHLLAPSDASSIPSPSPPSPPSSSSNSSSNPISSSSMQSTPQHALILRLCGAARGIQGLTVPQIGVYAAAMLFAGQDAGSDPQLFSHLSSAACALPASAYTWRSLSSLAQAMAAAGALRGELRNHTEHVFDSLPAANSDSLSVCVVLSALSRANALSASTLESLVRMSLSYSPREASLALCALARGGPRAAASPIALQMMNIVVRCTPSNFGADAVCQAARAHTMLEGVEGGGGGGGAGRREAFMRRIVEGSKVMDFDEVGAGNAMHLLHALCARAGSEDVVAKLLASLARKRDATWGVRDAASGINTLTKQALDNYQDASRLLSTLASTLISSRIPLVDTPSVAQAAGHFPCSSPLKKPLMLAAVSAIEAACASNAVTPTELATMASGITLDSTHWDAELRGLSQRALESIMSCAMRMQHTIFDYHSRAVILHAVARSRGEGGRLAAFFLEGLVELSPTEMDAQDAVLLLYACSLDPSLLPKGELLTWLMRSCLEGDIDQLPTGSAAILANAIAKVPLYGYLQVAYEQAAQVRDELVKVLAIRIARAPLNTLDPRSIVEAVNGFSTVWLSQYPSNLLVNTKPPSRRTISERSRSASPSSSSNNQPQSGDAGSLAGSKSATSSKAGQVRVSGESLFRKGEMPRRGVGDAILRRELSLRTIPLFETQVGALGELSLRDEVFSVLASACVAHPTASLALHGSLVISNLALSMAQVRWGEGKRGLGVSRAALGKHLAAASLLVKTKDFKLGDVSSLLRGVNLLVGSEETAIKMFPFDFHKYVGQVGEKVCHVLESSSVDASLQTHASLVHTLARGGLDTSHPVFSSLIQAMHKRKDFTDPTVTSTEDLGFAISAVGRVAGEDAGALCIRLCDALARRGYAGVSLKTASRALKGMSHAGIAHTRLVAWVGGMPEEELLGGGGKMCARLLVDIVMACRKVDAGEELRARILAGLVRLKRGTYTPSLVADALQAYQGVSGDGFDRLLDTLSRYIVNIPSKEWASSMHSAARVLVGFARATKGKIDGAHLTSTVDGVFQHMSGIITSLPPSAFSAYTVSYIASAYAQSQSRLGDKALFSHLSAVYPGGGRVTECARFAVALSRAGVMDKTTFRTIANDAVARPQEDMTVELCAQLAEAFARGGLLKENRGLTMRISKVMQASSDDSLISSLAKVVAAFASESINEDDDDLFAHAVQIVLHAPPDSISAYALSELLNAFTKAGRIDADLFTVLGTRAIALADQRLLTAGQMASILTAMASSKIIWIRSSQTEEVFRALSSSLRSLPRHVLKPQVCAVIASAYAKAKVFDDELFKWVSDSLRWRKRRVSEYTVQVVGILLYAFSRVEVNDQQLLDFLAEMIQDLPMDKFTPQAVSVVVTVYAGAHRRKSPSSWTQPRSVSELVPATGILSYMCTVAKSIPPSRFDTRHVKAIMEAYHRAGVRADGLYQVMLEAWKLKWGSGFKNEQEMIDFLTSLQLKAPAAKRLDMFEASTMDTSASATSEGAASVLQRWFLGSKTGNEE